MDEYQSAVLMSETCPRLGSPADPHLRLTRMWTCERYSRHVVLSWWQHHPPSNRIWLCRHCHLSWTVSFEMMKAQMQRASESQAPRNCHSVVKGSKDDISWRQICFIVHFCSSFVRCTYLTPDGRAALLHRFHSVLDLMKSTLWTPCEYVLICEKV